MADEVVDKVIEKKKVIFVMGQTASGKSGLALHLAQYVNNILGAKTAAIVNCDSIQVYRGLYIGSAQPTHDEKEIVPHYLYDYVDFPQEITAGEYARDFYSLIEKTPEQVVFVVGGTGFYFQAIEKGMFKAVGQNTELRAKLEKQIQENPDDLYTKLQSLDPESAEKIAKADHYRIVRALEIILTENRKLSEIRREQAENPEPFRWPLLKLSLLLGKDDLLPRVQERTKVMLGQGLIDEVISELQKGRASWAPLHSVGYAEVMNALIELDSSITEHCDASKRQLDLTKLNKKSLEEKIVQSTMKLAKKQRTWFQRDQAAHRFSSSQESRLHIENLVKNFIQQA